MRALSHLYTQACTHSYNFSPESTWIQCTQAAHTHTNTGLSWKNTCIYWHTVQELSSAFHCCTIVTDPYEIRVNWKQDPGQIISWAKNRRTNGRKYSGLLITSNVNEIFNSSQIPQSLKNMHAFTFSSPLSLTHSHTQTEGAVFSLLATNQCYHK